ncbi:MAG: histone deacetylase [Thermoproteota archaeon]|nr:histone deacetylase [Thermoproteota archaeon]
MTKTAILYSPKYLDHNPGVGHPESPNRLKVIMKELKASGFLEKEECSIIEPKPARIEDVELVHNLNYIKLVEQFCRRGGGVLDLGDTVASPESFDVALQAVGGALKAAELVMEKRFQNAFAFVRPPGHHAGPNYACGFCIFNNIAVAATHLLLNFHLERILILDVDAHHGNGTQEIFYDTNKVLYISLHQDPHGFPGTGFTDEQGEKEGLGYTVNIPFPFQVDDQIYSDALDQLAAPIIQQYKPQFILVSVGFDGHYTDPVASLSLSANGYLETFEKILNSASKYCKGRLVAVLEGGYSLPFIGKLATGTIARMMGLSYPVQDKRPTADTRVQKQAEKLVKQARNFQSRFWNLK